MENLIIYGIVAIVVIVNIVRNYQKEAKKNKERALAQARPRPVSSASQENTTQSSPAPFSRPRTVQSEISEENKPIAPILNSGNKYQTLTSMGYDYTPESVSSVMSDITDDKKEMALIYEEKTNSNAAQDLQLETSADLKRAFIHSIILERKY